MIKKNVFRKNLLTDEIDCGNIDSNIEQENLNGQINKQNPWIEVSIKDPILQNSPLNSMKVEKQFILQTTIKYLRWNGYIVYNDIHYSVTSNYINDLKNARDIFFINNAHDTEMYYKDHYKNDVMLDKTTCDNILLTMLQQISLLYKKESQIYAEIMTSTNIDQLSLINIDSSDLNLMNLI